SPRWDRATATSAWRPRLPWSRATRATRRPWGRGSPQLDGLARDGDALGAHLVRIVAARIADHRRLVARRQHRGRQAAILHPRRRRERHHPALARHLEADVAVRMLVARFLDDAVERHLLARVIAAPPVMRERRQGAERDDDESDPGETDVSHRRFLMARR